MSPISDLFLSPLSDIKKNRMELKESEKKLVESVNAIIEEEGFAKLGINKIARNAGYDKVLIYRYFGGLEGLITAWAKKYDFYIQAYDAIISKIDSINAESVREITKEILLTQLDFLRNNRTLQELLLWELSGDVKFKAIRELREENGNKLQTTLENKLEKRIKSLNMYITILISSINYVVISTIHYPHFNGVNFSSERSWDVYKNTLCDYVDLLFNEMEK